MMQTQKQCQVEDEMAETPDETEAKKATKKEARASGKAHSKTSAKKTPEPIEAEAAKTDEKSDTDTKPGTESETADGDEAPLFTTLSSDAVAARLATAGVVQRTRETLARVAELEQAAANSAVTQQLKSVSGMAGKQALRLGEGGLKVSRKGAGRAAEASRTMLLPRLKTAALALARQLSPKQIARDIQAIVVFGHRITADRPIEKLMFRPTAAAVSLDALTIRGTGRQEAHNYRPTPHLVFDWAMSAITDDLQRFAFIDYGAGKGRVLLMASLYPFRSIGGIECTEELHEDARMNIAQFPRSPMRCRRIECVLEDATHVATPRGPGVHYFFDPFSRVAFAQVLNGIAASYREDPRPLYLVLVDCKYGDLVRQTKLFRRARMPFRAQLASFLFSPYRIEVYKTDPA
ncbi:hypothetical protein V6C03_09725 [Methyloligella sp. 2.7D]|uniref:hypothetical protein n=1 Tax=unclassified Methyloligella TaxID=2625955 RepID=UPI00157BC44B|nr:hypothetical protein [Methyloligella sp. GL2]QKP77875.1 hypothetical protein HT051_10730 [Methyloligella sp. GL2]